MAYTASVPRVTVDQAPSEKSFLAAPTLSLMSASTSLLTRVGSAWYSTWARSGGLPAFDAVSSLVTRSSPWAWLLAVTWMSGCALFHSATTLSMLGTQVQKVSSTFWAGVPPPLPL